MTVRKPLLFGTGIARTFSVTIRHFFGRRITVQYPRQRNVIADRSRGALKIKGVLDEDTGFTPSLTEMAPCQARCPANVDARGYIGLIAQGRYDDAFELHLEKNPLPGVVGRICPHPCETVCRRAEEDAAVTICLLKRFMSDHVSAGRRQKIFKIPKERKDRMVAVVGGGPAGLSAAYYLAKCGYEVVIFERSGAAGGLLRVDALTHKLPGRVIDDEINDIKQLGVAVRTNTLVGPGGMELEDVFNAGFDAVFLGIGAHRKQASAGDDEQAGRAVKNKWLVEQGVALDPQGNIAVDKETGATSRTGIYAGGEAATGPSITVNAVGGARRAALGIDTYLNGHPSEYWAGGFPRSETVKNRYDAKAERAVHDKTGPAFAEKTAKEQAERCMSCMTEQCIDCLVCEKNCPTRAISIETQGIKNRKIISYQIDYGRCQLCGICVDGCPTRTLVHTEEFEMADYKRADAVYGKDKMLRKTPLREDIYSKQARAAAKKAAS